LRLDNHDDLVPAALRAELAQLADVLLWQFGHKSGPAGSHATTRFHAKKTVPFR
jgi:hypothetical protein